MTDLNDMRAKRPVDRDAVDAHKERMLAEVNAERVTVAQDMLHHSQMLFGDMLPGLLGVPAATVDQYVSGELVIPNMVASRIAVIVFIVTALGGSYNAEGVRSWFGRPRTQLDGKAPADILAGDWDPDTAPVQQVVDLSESLTHLPG